MVIQRSSVERNVLFCLCLVLQISSLCLDRKISLTQAEMLLLMVRLLRAEADTNVNKESAECGRERGEQERLIKLR